MNQQREREREKTKKPQMKRTKNNKTIVGDLIQESYAYLYLYS